MVAEVTPTCRPPEGTPDGAWALLARETGEMIAAKWQPDANITAADEWGVWWPDIGSIALRPGYLSDHGWRFHSIATPPADG